MHVQKVHTHAAHWLPTLVLALCCLTARSCLSLKPPRRSASIVQPADCISSDAVKPTTRSSEMVTCTCVGARIRMRMCAHVLRVHVYPMCFLVYPMYFLCVCVSYVYPMCILCVCEPRRVAAAAHVARHELWCREASILHR